MNPSHHVVFSADSIMNTAARPQVIMETGLGSYLTDRSGKTYLDFIQGWAVNCLGHCPPEIIMALESQATRLINPSPGFYNQPMIDLADAIVAASCFDHVFFCNSGAEANEGAIKLARKWGQLNRNGAFEIITMENAFHGRTLATMSASGKPQWESLFEPKVAGFVKVPFNNLEAVEQVISDRTVAIMLEPVQGEGGVVPASDAFLAGIRQLADRHGLLMIVDEVQTGIGRTGTLFGYQHADIEPDIMTLGKGLGGGVPLAALVSKRSASVFEHGDQGGTYNGNPLMTAVGNAVFQTVSHPEFLLNVRDVGDYLMTQLNRLSDRYRLKGVRGRGLLQALILDSERASEIVKSAFEKGLLINAPRPDVIRFMPSLRVTHSEIDQGISILESLL